MSSVSPKTQQKPQDRWDALIDTSNPSRQPHLQQIISARFTRRQLLQAMLAGGVVGAIGTGTFGLSTSSALALGNLAESSAGGYGFPFTPLPAMNHQSMQLAKGYQSQVVVKYGDKIGEGLYFGFNNDFLAYMPLNGSNDHGLLSVNHEYASTALMFPNRATIEAQQRMTAAEVRHEMAAVGHSVLEIKKDRAGQWQVIPYSVYARRVDATTPISLSGPVAGHPRVQTSEDATGKRVLGTFANCAGGVTPWGTVLFAEENIDQLFYRHSDRRRSGQSSAHGLR